MSKLYFTIVLICMLCINFARAESCVETDSSVPPRGCNWPRGVMNPTDTKYVIGTVAEDNVLHIDEFTLTVNAPENSENELPQYVPRILTRTKEAQDWLRVRGEYKLGIFGMGWNFYTLGIPLFGSYAQTLITATLFVKDIPSRRDYESLRKTSGNPDRGDFSKPNELFENLNRMRYHNDGLTTPVEEVIINGRKWCRYLRNSRLYPDDLHEYYITGLSPDRYLEIEVKMYPAPVYTDRYPRYAPEDQQPRWMKKSIKYKEQVISSLKITKPEGSKEPDLYEVPSSKSPIANQ